MSQRYTGFTNSLLFNVESLETLDKLNTIEVTLFYVIKKLEVVKAELVSHVQTNWRDWTFRDLTALFTQKRTKEKKFSHNSTGGRALTSRDTEIPCVYCQSSEHKANSCDKVTTASERKKILAEKRLCFNCAIGQHVASNYCKSKMS